MRFAMSVVCLLVLAASAQADPLDDVNAKRAARGLRPYIRDDGLTQGAVACASYRAERLMFGHTSSDFQFLPPGTPLISGSNGTAAGCAAYDPRLGYGFMACAMYDSYIYAGAASVMGADGKKYDHIFVSNSPSATAVGLSDGPKTVPPTPVPAMMPPVAPLAAPAAVEYRVEKRGLFGRRSVLVLVTGCSSAVTTTTATTTLTTTSTATAGACATGSCSTGSSTFRQRTVIRSR